MDEASPDTNFGGGASLFIRSQGGVMGDGDRRLLCSFDLGQLPADASDVLEATLRLIPEATSVLERTLRALEIAGAWTEAGVTWNTQPATDADHGTQLSTDDPQLFTVTASVQAVFPDGRPEFLVKDETEGSADAPEQEYSAREGTGAEPELVVTFKREATADFDSTVTVSKNQFSDLATDVLPSVDGKRFAGFHRIAITDDAGSNVEPWDVSYDTTRAALWVADGENVKVHRFSQDGTHEQAYDVPSGFTPSGVAFDGTDLWISDESDGKIKRFSIGTSTLTEEESHDHDFRGQLAWDGSNLWSVDPILQTVYKHNMDATLSVAESHDLGNNIWGLAFVDDEPDPYVLEDDSPFKIFHRSITDFTVLDSWAYTGNENKRPRGLAFLGRQAGGPLFSGEEDNHALLRHAGLILSSTLTIGKLIGSSDLDTTVQPANIDAHADMDTQVKAGIGGDVDLSTTVTPRPAGEVDLGTTVQPGNLSASSDLTSTVRPSTTEVAGQGRAEGSVAPTIEVGAADFAEISAEMGSELTHTQDGASTSLRRVIQLVDTQTAKTFPREATSEHGRSSTHDQLGRGDAILYAKRGDTFQPGDTIEYDGLDWEVIGLLGWELVGDERIYREVGLRRLSIVTRGRTKGVVQRSGLNDLVSELTVNVP